MRSREIIAWICQGLKEQGAPRGYFIGDKKKGENNLAYRWRLMLQALDKLVEDAHE